MPLVNHKCRSEIGGIDLRNLDDDLFAELHRAWLQKGYDLGLFLCSGPKEPPTGGYLVARAESADVLKTMFAEEPYTQEGLATFTFTEFQPVKRQPWTEAWFNDTTA